MSGNEENTTDVQVERSAVPNAAAVKRQVEQQANEAGAQFDAQIQDASASLTDAKNANGFFARWGAYREAGAEVNAKTQQQIAGVEAQMNVISTKMDSLLRKDKELTAGALKAARKRVAEKAKRVAAEIADLEAEIDGLTQLRDVAATMIENGISLPKIDINGDGVVDEADVAHLDADGDGDVDSDDLKAYDEQIASLTAQKTALEQQVNDDPVLKQATAMHDAIQQGLELMGVEVQNAKAKKAEVKQAGREELGERKTAIAAERSEAVVSAKTAFNEAAEGKDNAIKAVKEAGADVIAQEQADEARYNANVSAAPRERRQNVISKTFQAVADAWQAIKDARQAAYDEETPAEADNKALLEERAQKFGGPAPK